MKISTKLGGGYLLVLAMVVICSGAGFYGVSKLSGLLNFITGPAWDTADGAMEGSIGIEAEMIGVSLIVSGQVETETAEAMLSEGKSTAEEALGRMINAGLLSRSEVDLVKTEKQHFREAQEQLLQAHSQFQQADRSLRNHFNNFQQLMTQAEEIGDSAVESFQQNPNKKVSWNTGLSEKWAAADGGMETQIELLTRFYNYQRLVSLMKAKNSEQEDSLNRNLSNALTALEEKSQQIIAHPLFKDNKVNQGTFSGQSLSQAISASLTQHKEDFNNAQEQFYRFRDRNLNYQRIAQEFLTIIEKIEESGDSKVEGQMKIVADTQSTTFILIVLSTLISIACVVAILVFVVREIIHSIEGMSYASQKIADGDLTVEVCKHSENASNNELQMLSFNMSRMTKGLRDTISNVSLTSNMLASQAEQLSSVSNETRESVLEQQSRTGQAASASTEMSASCKEVAQSTEAAKDSADQAQSLVQDGKRVVSETITMIRSLSKEVSDTALVIGELSDDSQKIGNVLDVIRGIAEQTNLLALNAAIEAARAGEQGRGFAVVADEVRSLAQRTQESTQEIQTVIEGLQSRTKEAHQAMDSSQAKVTESTEQAAQAEQSLDDITREVAEIAKQNGQIAEAMMQQEAAAEEISVIMVDIENLAGHTVGAVNQTSESSSELATQASNLQNLVAKFTI